ncbi:MAG: ATP-binding protein [Planctomycetes bacterium]|nr:ATP-binding protein [Planctomycetota bacterium]
MPYFEIKLTQKLHRVYDVGDETTIGRAPQCDIQLLSRAVSRRHAKTELGEDGVVIISDLGTKNGIKVNGARIEGAAVIGEGDSLLVGDVSMVFRAGNRRVDQADAIDLRGRKITPQDVAAAGQAKVTFRLAADADALATFQAEIARQRISELDFDELSCFRLQIALKEALDNARIHGSNDDSSRSVFVTFREDSEEFLMTVQDEGPGFDVDATMRSCQELDALDAIRNRAQLGKPLGLGIVLNCVDRIQFEAKGSTIHLGRFKEAGQLFVISDDGDEAGGEAPPQAAPETTPRIDPFALDDEPEPPRLDPFARDDESGGGPLISLDDLL